MVLILCFIIDLLSSSTSLINTLILYELSSNYYEYSEHGQEVRWLRILRIGYKGYSLKLYL
jgi:hypothetical protein